MGDTTEYASFGEYSELIHVILEADSCLNLDLGSVRAFVLNAFIVLDCIWHATNLVVHQATPLVGI